MTEKGASPSKRVKLGKGQLESLSKEELLQRCQEQDAYIKCLVPKQSEQAKIKQEVYVNETEEILEQQQIGTTGPENSVVIRATNKRQEPHGSPTHNEDLQNLPTGSSQLQSLLTDSANNIIFKRAKVELDSFEDKDEELQHDLEASTFTSNSQTRRLMTPRRMRPTKDGKLRNAVSSATMARKNSLDKNYADEIKTNHTVFGYNGYLYTDKDLTTRIAQPIYKGKNNYYFDEGLSTVEIVNIDDVCIDDDSLNYNSSMNSEVSPCVNMDTNFVHGASGDDVTVHQQNWDTVGMDRKLDVHEMWTPEETKFLIMIIKEFVTYNQEELPKTLTELETKIRRGRGKQKVMWLDITEKLTFTFMKQFDVKRVARKWQTLTDGLKKVLLIRSKTGKTTSKFAFLSEMMELIDNGQDIKSVLTGTPGHTIAKSDELKKETVPVEQKSQSENPEIINATGCERTAMTSELNQSSDGERVSPIPSPSTVSTDGETSRNDEGSASPVPCSSSVRSRKRNRTDQSDDALLEYLRESDNRMQEQQDRILEEMAQFRGSFVSMFGQLLKKM